MSSASDSLPTSVAQCPVAAAPFRHETIEAFILTGRTDLAPNSAQTYRSWLRHMRATLAWLERGEQAPPPMKLRHLEVADQGGGVRVVRGARAGGGRQSEV
ncbi:hypothetical protein AB0J35_04985 [Nonomuraea angiospora]|uniref:hypothetical protein n=1 Tax=Nonomuraea angiospora TaxID=46172 RepID=UPI00343C9B43